MFARRLTREIGALIVIKVAALILLFVLFFSPAHRPDIDDSADGRANPIGAGAPMTPDFTVVELSRLQFALTAMYHFLFVPLTLGLVVPARHHGERLRDDRPRDLAAA